MKAKVNITVKQTDTKLPFGTRSLIKKACNTTLEYEKFSNNAEVDVSIVDDNEIREINNEFRNIDKETDVLSFPLGQDGVYDENPITKASMLGDIVISIERAIKQAELYGHSVKREIAFLTVHSMLHLLGYDHVNGGEEEKIMREKEEAILKKMGLAVKKG